MTICEYKVIHVGVPSASRRVASTASRCARRSGLAGAVVGCGIRLGRGTLDALARGVRHMTCSKGKEGRPEWAPERTAAEDETK